MESLFTKINMDKDTLKSYLVYLDSEAVTLLPKTETPRVGAINNIRATIRSAIDDLNEPEGKSVARQVIAEVRVSLQELKADPESWGSHEFLREELEGADTERFTEPPETQPFYHSIFEKAEIDDE